MGIHWLKWPLVTYTRGEDFYYANFSRKSDQFDTIVIPLSIDSKAKAMKSEGIDVCSFAAGEPDFRHTRAHQGPQPSLHWSPDLPSIPLARESRSFDKAISEKFHQDNQLAYSPSQVHR